ncbi:MAG TPA: SAM-dependent methyltransferase [Pyrinomonadaceae bacterium]|nr:SAM-dependent methyltransferase [Pyrinomonadaceae bacterium]
MANDVSKFIDAISKSLAADTFVKLTLGNYKGADEQLQKIIVRRIVTKKGERLDFLFRYKTKDISKNYAIADGVELIQRLIGADFFGAHFFTTKNDIALDISKKGKTRLTVSSATQKEKPPREHDREKKFQVDQHSRYLRELGITSEMGEVIGKQRDKWTQINKFVEIIGGLIDNSKLKERESITVVDMGSGKGYLTFALYDYLRKVRGIESKITGVEVRKELVDLCNKVAGECGFDGLIFVQNTIEGFEMLEVDMLIALHACDTATDDALYKGITSHAEIIVAAPCCHKEIRRQIKSPALLKNILKHGTLMESTAETITDGLRALLLEHEGYATKVFEFIGVEHTPKNNMIVGTRRHRTGYSTKFVAEIKEIKDFYGIEDQRLEHLLNSNSQKTFSHE